MPRLRCSVAAVEVLHPAAVAAAQIVPPPVTTSSDVNGTPRWRKMLRAMALSATAQSAAPAWGRVLMLND
jgi:hypothetical protein